MVSYISLSMKKIVESGKTTAEGEKQAGPDIKLYFLIGAIFSFVYHKTGHSIQIHSFLILHSI